MIPNLYTLITIIGINLLFACGVPRSANEPNEQGLEHSGQRPLDPIIKEPNEFLPFIRATIRQDSLDLLKYLCHPDPSRMRNLPAVSFCNIGMEDNGQIHKFAGWFGHATIDGAIKIINDTAWVPATLQGGDLHSIHILEKTNDQWYIVAFALGQ